MKHKKAIRNHPASDVAIGVILEIIAVTLLIREFRTGTAFWGTLFAGFLVAGAAPWTWWAIAYLRNGRPPDPLSLYANDSDEDDDTGEIFPAVLTADDLTINAEPFVIDVTEDPDGTTVLHPRPPMGPIATWLTTPYPPNAALAAGVAFPAAIRGAIEQDKQKTIADRLADDLDAAGGSYTGDPRLAPGFWAKGDDESEDDYWRRLCGHDRPNHRHLITCPDWTPR